MFGNCLEGTLRRVSFFVFTRWLDVVEYLRATSGHAPTYLGFVVSPVV